MFPKEIILADLAANRLDTLDLSSYKKTDLTQPPHKEKVYEGHANIVYALAVLPDGRLASGSFDKTIKLWDGGGQCSATLAGHTSAILALAVLPDGRLASGGRDDKTIKLWDSSGKCVATLEGHTHYVKALAVLPDGRLASGSFDRTIKLWNRDGQCVATLEGHTQFVTALAVLPDGRLASGSYDRTIKLWDNSGQCVATLEGHADTVTTLAVLSDGRLASGSYDKTIKLWDSEGKCITTLVGHSSSVYALVALPDGRLASGSYDNTIKLWKSDGQCESTTAGHAGGVTALTVLPDGRIVSGSKDDKNIALWQFSHQDLAFSDIEPILQRLTGSKVSSLNCQQVKLTDSNVPALVELLASSKLRALDIRKTLITESGLRELVAGLAQHSTLRTIYHEAMAQVFQTEPSPSPAPAAGPDFSVSYILKPEAFKYGAVLSQDGGYGIVYKGTLLPNIPVAIKQLKAKSLSDAALAEFTTEMSLLVKIQLHSKHTVRLHGCCLESPYAMVMEYMENGSLFRLLHSDKPLPWQTRYHIACDMANGLETLHYHNILHRDIKSLNVLLDKHFNAKWCDFGFAKIKTETRTTTTSANSAKGTLAWLPPEKLRAKPHTKASDIYSLGITFWELVSRKLPYEGAEGDADVIRGLIKEGDHDDIPEACPPKFAKLIQWCWSAKPEQRPTATEVSTALQDMEQEFIAADNNMNKTPFTSKPQYGFFDSTNSAKPAAAASNPSFQPAASEARYGKFDSAR